MVKSIGKKNAEIYCKVITIYDMLVYNSDFDHNSLFAHTYVTINNKKSIRLYAPYSLIFSLLYSFIKKNRLNSIQSNSTINPVILKNAKCLVVRACAPVINQK